MDTEYSNLRSKEKKLEQELSQVRNKIRDITIEEKIKKIGKYYKNLDDIEFYKVFEYFQRDGISYQSDTYGCITVSFSKHKNNEVFIDTDDSQTLNEKYCVEITEEEFYEQYNKALDIIRNRLNIQSSNSG